MPSMSKATLKTLLRCGRRSGGHHAGAICWRVGGAVTVLEKHQDFFPRLRGDTVHPSTLEVMYGTRRVAGIFALPHQELTKMGYFREFRVYGC